MRSVSVALLPELIQPAALCGSTAIVIDVLRATSVIVTALCNGAGRVLTCQSIERARQLASASRESVLLCGERGGVPIEGFDLGNSPREYCSEVVAGNTLIFTTTNGTKALASVDDAEAVITASFLNLSAVIQRVAYTSKVLICCAGTDRQVSNEDVLLAGAIAEQLTRSYDFDPADDSTKIAIDTWLPVKSISDDPNKLAATLAASHGGRNLSELGYSADLLTVSALDAFPQVPTRFASDPIELRLAR